MERNFSESQKATARALIKKWYADRGEVVRARMMNWAAKKYGGRVVPVPVERLRVGDTACRLAHVKKPDGWYLNAHFVVLGDSPKRDRICESLEWFRPDRKSFSGVEGWFYFRGRETV